MSELGDVGILPQEKPAQPQEHNGPFDRFDTIVEQPDGYKPADVLRDGDVVSFAVQGQHNPFIEPIVYGTNVQPQREWDATTTEVLIGATPEDFQMPDAYKDTAGDPGDYLMFQKTVKSKMKPDGTKEERTDYSYLYLDATDVEGVEIKGNKMVIFNPNQTRKRAVHIQGKATNIAKRVESSAGSTS